MEPCDQSINSEDEAVAGPSGYNGGAQEPTEASCNKARQKRWKYPTAYFNFLADFREDHKGKNWAPKDIARKAGEAWRKLSSEQKKPYEEAALRNRKHGKGCRRSGNRRGNDRPSMGRRKMASRGGRKATTRRVDRRRDESDYETDGSSSTDSGAPKSKRRKTTSSEGKGKGGKRRPEEEYYDSEVSCICGMKHCPKSDGKTRDKKGKGRVRKRAIEGGCEESDAVSSYSSYSDD